MSLNNAKPNSISQIKDLAPLISIAIITLALDQLTKAMIRSKLAVVGTMEIIKDFVEFCYTENTGAAFGTFHGRNSIFIAISLVAIVFIFVYYRKFKGNIWMRVSLGFILGGALGNLVDRILFGHVTDFIRVRIWLVHSFWWPIFNVADSGITIGAIILIIVLFRESYKGTLEIK